MTIMKINTSCVFLVLLLISSHITLSDQYDVDEDDGVELKKEEPVLDSVESEHVLAHVVTDVNKTLPNLDHQVPLANVSMENKTQIANETKKLVNCKSIVYDTDETEPSVAIINGTYIAKVLQVKPDIAYPSTEAECVLVFFYTKSCPFSAQAAPHFNALARTYPNIKMVGLDALKYNGINAQYGIVGVPTLKLFHNGRPVAKFNETEYNVHLFSKFIHTITGQEPLEILVTSKDFQGPISSVVVIKTDYLLILSWLFIIVCNIYYFMQSKWWDMIVEMIQNNWRESEAQHEHND